MQSLSNLIPRSLDQIKQNGQLQQSSEQPKAVALHQNPEAKQKLAVMLLQSWNSLRSYGKDPEQLEGIIAMFNLVLADYPLQKIEEAFAFYLRSNNEMPAPADIANIIERGNKPPFERAVYLSLVKRKQADPYAYGVITRAEEDYIADYERWIVTGKN